MCFHPNIPRGRSIHIERKNHFLHRFTPKNEIKCVYRVSEREKEKEKK